MSTEIKWQFFNYKNTKAVDVYLEGRKSKTYVGRLTKEKIKDRTKYLFSYDEKYFNRKDALSLGPELPLTKRTHSADKLFVPFLDRIPSKDNPAYVEYCKKFGIATDETGAFVLLVTVASRGPSSFVFEPVFEEGFTGTDAKKFRQSFGLTVREFATAFDISIATVTKLENGTSTGRDILKRIEIYAKFPIVALYEVEKNWSSLHEDVRNKLHRALSDRLTLLKNPNGE